MADGVVGVVVVLLLMAGCASVVGPLPDADTPPGIGFNIADTVQGPGDTVRMTLSNRSDSLLGYWGANACDVTLQRRENGEWTPVRPWPSPTPCILLPLQILQPGDSTVFTRTVDVVQSGVYRFSTTVEWPEDTVKVEIATNGFRVVGS